MSDGIMYLVSINVSQLIRQAKDKHTAFKRAKNGDTYAAGVMWINSEDDEYGQIGNMRLNIPKDSDEDKIYFGNVTDPDSLAKRTKKKGKGKATKKKATNKVKEEIEAEESGDGLPY